MSGFRYARDLPRVSGRKKPEVLVQFRVPAKEHAALLARAAAEGLTMAAQARRDVMAANRSPTSAPIADQLDQVWNEIRAMRQAMAAAGLGVTEK